MVCEHPVAGAEVDPHTVMADPARVLVLAESGLSHAPDPVLDELAERVRRWLGVPVALVSLVQPDQQVFPGQAGLPEPWARERRTPLSHSFCQHVVASSEPLVVTDARDHPLVRNNDAVEDLAVIAYAGMPLTDADGRVLGSLCAIDHRPRQWTDRELDMLAGLAVACSSELRLRLSRADADRERDHRDRVERDLAASYERSQLLLHASQTFTAATDSADVRRRLAELVESTLQPSWVLLALVAGDEENWRLHDGASDTPLEGLVLRPRSEPASAVGRQDEITLDGASDAPLPPTVGSRLAQFGAGTALVVRLDGQDEDLGLMVLGWPAGVGLEFADRVFATSVAGYVAQAVSRVRFVEHRVSVAHEMQSAMLAPLPELEGVELVARYRAADAREDVGGDWYDASLLPDMAGRARSVLAASVGDVVGHTLDSAIRMGQVRSMLRQAAWDVAATPSRVLAAVERANAGDGLHLAGTAVLVHLQQHHDGQWTVTWTNAGHPPPLVVTSTGGVRRLGGLDPMFGFPIAVTRPRRDHHVELADGATIFLHTDGLIERPGEDLDDGARRLEAALERRRGLPLQAMVEGVLSELASTATDDVVVLAIRLGDAGRPPTGTDDR